MERLLHSFWQFRSLNLDTLESSISYFVSMMQMAALSVAFSNLCMYGCMHENGNCFYYELDGTTLPFKNACFNYSDEVLQFH